MEEVSFDTELTLLYKRAMDEGLPIELFILRPRTKEDEGVFGTPNTVIESIYEFIDSHPRMSLLELYEELLRVAAFPRNYIKDKISRPLARIYFESKTKTVNPSKKGRTKAFLDVVMEIVEFYYGAFPEKVKSLPNVPNSKLYTTPARDEFIYPPTAAAIRGVQQDHRILRRLIESQKEKVAKIAQNIIDVQQGIKDRVKVPLPRSPIYRKSESVTYDAYLWDPESNIQESIDIRDGFSFFNNLVLSENVPFVQYNAYENQADKSYYKIFRGKTVDTEPTYKNIMIPPEEKLEKKDRNTILMKVWFHHPYETKPVPMHMAPPSAFVTVTMSLQNGTLNFDVPHKDLENSLDRYIESLEDTGEKIDTHGVNTVSEWVILDAVYEAFPKGILFGNRIEEGVKAEIFIYNVDLDWASFAYDITFNPLMRRYLYIEEATHPQSLKNLLSSSVRYAPYPIDEPDIPIEIKRSKVITKRGLSATIRQEYTKLGAAYDLYDPKTNNTLREVLPSATPYILLNISRTANLKAINDFLSIFTHLLVIYNENRAEIIEFYETMMTVKEQRSLFPPPPISEKSIEGKILIELNDLLPELTKRGFARASQGVKKPQGIIESAISGWVRQTFNYNHVVYHKEVLPFPKPDPTEYGTVVLIAYQNNQVMNLVQRQNGELQWKRFSEIKGKVNNPEAWIVCPNDASPFVGLKNKKMDRYSYIPSCFNTPHTNLKVSGAKITTYQYHYLGFREKKSRTKAENILKGNKILKPGQKGFLPPEMVEIFKQYSNTAAESSFLRYGVPTSPNSLLHSVLLALEDPIYFEKKTFAAKEAYVRRVRRYIATRIYPGLLKQELYDRTLNEIWSILCDVDAFLDPSIFYRALEVVFKINIYVYGYITENRESGKMVLPRNKIFHVQPYREWPTVLVLKNWGGAADIVQHPQSELIIEEIKGSKTVMVFDQEMGKINYDVLQQTEIVFMWKITQNGEMEVHQNIYSERTKRYVQPDYDRMIRYRGRYQILDDYGKMRGLVFNYSSDQRITMFFAPSQPVNLPLTTKEKLMKCGDSSQEEDLEEEEDFPRCTSEIATDVFGDPKSITKNPGNMVTGLWFGHDITVYVPIIPTEEYADLPQGDSNPFEAEFDESILRLDKMKKDVNYLQQIVWWLYLVYRHPEYLESSDLQSSESEESEESEGSEKPLEPGSSDSLEPDSLKPGSSESLEPEDLRTLTDFVETYITFDTTFTGDSAFYYNLKGINRTFPDVDTIEDAIASLELQEQTYLLGFDESARSLGQLFRDGKIVFYNRTPTEDGEGFGDKMILWLRQKVQLAVGMEKNRSRPTGIENYYASSRDFQQQTFVSVFVGKVEVKKWLDSITTNAQMHQIHQKGITATLALSTEPFIFKDSNDNKIYHIQNVLGGSKMRALNVGRMWQTQKRNGGWLTPPTTSEYPHIIYGNTIDGLMVLENNLNLRSRVRFQDIPVILGTQRKSTEYLRLLQYNIRGTPRYAAMLELL